MEYKLSIIDGQIVAFCKTNDFTTQVRQAVNDELFWRMILQKYSVDSIVQAELNTQVPVRVQYEVQSIVPKIVRDQLDNYTKIEIPSHVAKSMSEQISGFLNNHNQMTQLLLEHSNTLNSQLEISATQTLDRLTNEEKYHEVTNSHLSNITKRFDQQIIEFSKVTQAQLVRHQSIFNDELIKMQQQVNKEIQALAEASDKLVEMEHQLSIFKWLVSGMAVVFIGGLFFMRD
jgi:myosin heavy subunit